MSVDEKYIFVQLVLQHSKENMYSKNDCPKLLHYLKMCKTRTIQHVYYLCILL